MDILTALGNLIALVAATVAGGLVGLAGLAGVLAAGAFVLGRGLLGEWLGGERPADQESVVQCEPGHNRP